VAEYGRHPDSATASLLPWLPGELGPHNLVSDEDSEPPKECVQGSKGKRGSKRKFPVHKRKRKGRSGRLYLLLKRRQAMATELASLGHRPVAVAYHNDSMDSRCMELVFNTSIFWGTISDGASAFTLVVLGSSPTATRSRLPSRRQDTASQASLELSQFLELRNSYRIEALLRETLPTVGNVEALVLLVANYAHEHVRELAEAPAEEEETPAAEDW